MNARFIGRKRELESLQKAYEKTNFQMCVLYGRRRIGKTTLINEFIKDKEHIAFTAIKGNIERNLMLFSECVVNHFMPGMSGLRFERVEDILQFITRNIETRKLILVIDELPYLAEEDSSVLSILQREIDEHWLQKNIFLILCGSSVSFMEQEILSSKSPVYGRRTMQIDLKPFDYLDTAQFVPNYSYEEKAICYGVTGGVAKYISMFDPEKNLDENISALYFSPSGFMYEEPQNLLVQEFKNAPVYDDVISAIANGANKAVEIKDRTKLESASVHNILDNLMKTRIVEKVYALTDEKNRKKVQYHLTDGAFQFWHLFIPHAIPMIEAGNGKEYYLNFVKPRLHEYMGEIFEKMCRHYLLLHAFSENMPCTVTEVGKWYGSNPQKKEQTDIDVVGIDTIHNRAILGECKFRNSQIDKSMLDDLKDRNGLIDHRYTTVAYFLFSLGGFSKWFEENRDTMVRTVGIEQLYDHRKVEG